MRLCVGATSRLVVEEAARARVAMVIASRRQVNGAGGYTGLTQRQVVEIVEELGDGATIVARDHGGPGQGGTPIAADPWAHELDEDVQAGFGMLHLDVSRLPVNEQLEALRRAVDHFRSDDVRVAVGGERDLQPHIFSLLAAVQPDVDYAVIALGGHVWADRQQGYLRAPEHATITMESYRYYGVESIAHNLDFAGGLSRYAGVVDYGNVAPELGVVETDAWLRALPTHVGRELLGAAYATGAWERWFDATRGEGSWFERARCALRYHWPRLSQAHAAVCRSVEPAVRGAVRDHIDALARVMASPSDEKGETSDE